MAKKTFRVVVLPGDGIGPEVVAEATRVLEVVSAASTEVELKLESHDFGGCAIDSTGQPLPESTLKACQEADAILMGSIGGPKWGVNSKPPLLKAWTSSWSASSSVVRTSVHAKSSVRARRRTPQDTMIYSVPEVERITRVAAQIALAADPPLAIHSIDKANVLASSRLWRKVVTETLQAEYPQLKLDHHLVDSAAMVIVSSPRKLNGVVLTENLFGDILSDESSVIPGSLGLLPSASLAGAPSVDDAASANFKPTSGLYEPIHGSAPDIAGQGIANPIGTILSAAMLLRYSLGLERYAKAIEEAVRKVLDEKEKGGLELRTADLGGSIGTKAIGDKIVETLKTLL
ncbi:3-isopropylmalate dehydrogenase [Grifola frondosa]|uniref:3-isopropylmalate dehydrogenase n=1 Tax=Grifola frondosa TaxID=5627 RepID=A0A1C7MI59_GRIFR|nr:3-isopropylmalate dehydrogenase [Grifola frondosa]